MGCVKTVGSHKQKCKIEKSKKIKKRKNGNKQKEVEGEKDEAVNEKYRQLHMFEDRFVASRGFGRILNKIWVFVCGFSITYVGICIGWVRLGYNMWGSGGVIEFVVL